MAARRLCRVDALTDGSAQGFALDRPGHDSMFLVKHEGTVYGYRNDCPHWPGSPMAWRKDAYLDAHGTHIACHSHGARFDIETGLCIAGPCAGQSLDPLELYVDEAGTVLVEITK